MLNKIATDKDALVQDYWRRERWRPVLRCNYMPSSRNEVVTLRNSLRDIRLNPQKGNLPVWWWEASGKLSWVLHFIASIMEDVDSSLPVPYGKFIACRRSECFSGSFLRTQSWYGLTFKKKAGWTPIFVSFAMLGVRLLVS